MGSALKVITVEPGVAGSVRMEERPEVEARADHLLVQAIGLGVCGTDREILAGSYGWAPGRSERLVLGHESLGRVLQAPDGCGFSAGDHVVGIVRRPDPVPCAACSAGEWDMCLNGRYVERGIKSLDGYGAERFLLEPDYAVRVAPSLGTLGVLLEPASVVAKAWDHIYRIGQRTRSWQPKSALITGAGPVGLLAALMAVQRGLDLHVLDRAEGGPKVELTRTLGGTYHERYLPKDLDVDIVVECTGAPQLVIDVMCGAGGRNGIVCLTGVSGGGRTLPFDSGNFNRSMVLQNDVVFGSVNANRRHYELAASSLAAADPLWLAGLLTRRVPLMDWREAFERRDGDIKVILEFEPQGS